MAKLVSKTYGDALFAVAMEENRMDEFYEAVKALVEILLTNEDFGKLMNHPKIMKEDKVKIVEETFGGKLPKEVVGIMVLMISKGRASEMLSVFEYFVDLVKEEKKIGKADVTTAVELTKAQKEKVEKKLLETVNQEYGDKTVIITAHRMSSVVDCDEIIYMKDGKITERGTFAELMALQGDFAEVYNIQQAQRQQMVDYEALAAEGGVN